MDAVEAAQRIALGALVVAERRELADCQARLKSLLAESERQTRALLEHQLETTLGPNWREYVRRDMEREGYGSFE